MPLGYTMRQPQGDDLSERLSAALKRFFALMAERGGGIESSMRDTTMPQRQPPTPERPQPSGGGRPPSDGLGGEVRLPAGWDFVGGETTDTESLGQQGRNRSALDALLAAASGGLRGGGELNWSLPWRGEDGEMYGGGGGGFSQSNPIERWVTNADGSRRKVYGDEARAQDAAIRQQMAVDSLASSAAYWDTLAMQTGNPRHIAAAQAAKEQYNQYLAIQAEKERFGRGGFAGGEFFAQTGG